MKRMKKYVIGFVAAMVLSTGLVTAAFASGAIVWGGEDDIAFISDTLTFLDKKLDTTLSEKDILKKERDELAEKLKDEQDENSSTPNGLAKINKELREANKILAETNETLRLANEDLAARITQLETDKTTDEGIIADLTTKLESSTTRVTELESSLAASNELTKTEQGKLAQAIQDVENLKIEAQEIRNSYDE